MMNIRSIIKNCTLIKNLDSKVKVVFIYETQMYTVSC